MATPFQSRKILLLDASGTTVERQVRTILVGPLGLAKTLACLAFTGGGQALVGIKDQIDSIKKVAAGLARAERLASSYAVADYASYLFGFQQFFNSSYRARQGGVLEAAVRQVLEDSGAKAYEK